jgi:hypothetical protein
VKEDRRFGFVVGSAFGLLGAVLFFWRHRVAAGSAFAGLGALLVVLALVAPVLLAAPHRLWMAFARGMGRVNTAVFLSIIFFLVLTPLGFLMRILGRDELRRRRAAPGTMWVPYPVRVADPRHFERMF